MGHCLWIVLDADIWGLGANAPKDTRWQLSIQRVRALLQTFYSEHRRSHPDTPLTELEDLTLSIMGKVKGKLPSFKAVETKHLVPFVLGLLLDPAFPRQSRESLYGAGEALTQLIEVIDSSPDVLEPLATHALHEAYKRFPHFCALGGVPMRPTNHLLGHMVHAATAAGNPRLYGTFEDEGLNSVLKGIGAAAHRLVWEYRVHLAYEQWDRAAVARRLRA